MAPICIFPYSFVTWGMLVNLSVFQAPCHNDAMPSSQGKQWGSVDISVLTNASRQHL
jgi:hypothetical protein